VRRLDAALAWPGLTGHQKEEVARQAALHESGVEPPHSKLKA
jgi:hypothetical protein